MSNPGQRSRRPLYAPPPSRQHTAFNYWFPLVTISTLALGGLAAWVWSERSDDDDDRQAGDDKPPRPSTGLGGGYPTQGAQPYPGPPPPQGMPFEGPVPSQSAGPQGVPPSAPVGGEAAAYYGGGREVEYGEGTFFGQMRGAMRRTPSPQQFFDNASKQVGAAAAAAGAALGSIMEEDRDEYYREGRRAPREGDREGFSDHERWSEEAEEKMRVGGGVEGESERRAEAARSARDEAGDVRKRTVAVVLSADGGDDSAHDEQAFHTEHASILSHLPPIHDPSITTLYILLYAPTLPSLPPLSYQPGNASPNSALGSSYSNINTPGSELPPSHNNKTFDTLYNAALALVSHPSHILPFTTPSGYVQILRHLAPQTAYVSDTLAGREGDSIAELRGWVGHTVLVAGDGGHAGLADTETEDEGAREERRWYERSGMVGLGKEVEVVDAVRVGDDWARRFGGRQ